MPVNDFSSLKFKKGNIQFKDKRELMEAPIKGSFTRAGLRLNLQKISNSLKNKKGAMVSVAFHYKKVNDWCPGMYTNAGDNVNVYDPSDSDQGAMYDGDTIDGAIFYVIKNDDEIAPTHQKPKKEKGRSFHVCQEKLI